MAEGAGGTIKYIFETHFHADFVSGHVDLSKKSGAPIVFGPTASPAFDSIIAEDNQEFKVGDITIKVLHTPGHTPESVTYLLIDENGKEHAIFTGDTLFLGDVGRPDLAIKSDLTQFDLAGMLFDSLRNRIMTLPNDLVVYPAHGAGSSCGKNMSTETVGTLGDQKQTNYALRADMTRDEFIAEVTDGISPPPSYFPKNAMMNKMGYDTIDEVISRGNRALNSSEFNEALENGALILDVRNQEDFMLGFIPNSLFIGLNGTFAMWVGALIEDIKQPIVLVAPEGKEEETVLRLARVGYDHTIGYLKGGIESFEGKLNTIKTISVNEFQGIYNDVNVVDVRKPGEFSAEHVADAKSYPLDFINEHLNELEKGTPYHIHCAGGYRSVIAISILMQHGYDQLTNITEGYRSFDATKMELTDFVCPSTLK
jgi:glyoxylase-like metal-dependent hydrolase (beta-lactamase superfamily II)/rhodanese-related sulfurtransferase